MNRNRRSSWVASGWTLCLWLIYAATGLAAPHHEVGTIVASQADGNAWRAVTFAQAFQVPPVVVVGPPSANDPAPASVRVRNVTATGFELQIDEWDYLDGAHAAESLNYLALEPGVHAIGGRTWEAGRAAGVAEMPQTIRLTGRFSTPPVVLAQAETIANAQALIPRVRGVTRQSFQLRVQAQRTNPTPLTGESVAYVAVTMGAGKFDGAPYFAGRTGAIPTQTWKPIKFQAGYTGPAFFGQTQTSEGSDACPPRIRKLSSRGVELLLDEEYSQPAGKRKIRENVGYLVFGAAEATAKLELGTVVSDPAAPGGWQKISLGQKYTRPVVVMGPPTSADPRPVTVRVRNVTRTAFEFRLENWNPADPAHPAEEVSYVVMEEGVFTIGGLRWQAGRVPGVTSQPAAKIFAQAFANQPILLAQTATANEAGAVQVRVNSVTASGFDVELDEAEAADGHHAAEEVHFVAIQRGVGHLQEGNLLFETAGPAAGVTDAFQHLPFAQPVSEPIFLATAQTRQDADPAGLRRQNLTAGGVELRLEEETTADAETAHGAEGIGYLVVASIADGDGDGLPDKWEVTHHLDPSDPADAALDPDADGLNNLAEYRNETDPAQFDSRGRISITATVPNAFEADGVAAKFLLQRTGSTLPARVYFTTGGLATATTDYVLKSAAGATLGQFIDLPAGSSSAEIVVEPVADAQNEYPESVALNLTAHPHYTLGTSSAAATLMDAADLPANERLFVAFFSAQDGAQTFASGLATLYLNGPNNRARVNLNFSGLTSNQTNAYIRYGVPAGIGPELRPTLPIGQVVDQTWNITPVGTITGQNIVDGLFRSGGKYVYINIGTGTYPAGEIAGTWERETGSTEFQPPADPPALEAATGDELRRDVARFLTQATFGPTEAEIDALANAIATTHGGDRLAGFSAWIDQQLARDQTRLLDYTQAADAEEFALRGGDPANPENGEEPNYHNRRRGWWLLAARAHDEFRQRVTFALSEIFVVSEFETEIRNRHYGAANYYDTLGSFIRTGGRYRDLLEAVSKSPVMGKYLSHLKNQKAITDPQTGQVLISPDENYAREIMQLFSIGLVHRHPDGTLKLGANGLPIPTYSNADITELARVFTGWSFGKRHGNAGQGYPVVDNANFNQGGGPAYFQASWINPMINFAEYHDSEAKTVLGANIPANLDGEADLDAALEIIAGHANTAPFLSRLLIERLVTSNPSAGYIHRVSRKFEDNGAGVRGDLVAVLKAILLDYEARSLAITSHAGHGKQKEPIIRYVQLIRALDGQSQIPLARLNSHGYPATQFDNFPAGTTLLRYPNTDARLGQTPQRAPTVFNWFLPDFNPGGAIASAGLVAPEMQLTTETSVANAINYHYALVQANNGQSVDPMFGAANGNEDNVRLDRTPFVEAYDLAIAEGKTVAEAVTLVLDRLDLLLLSGQFRASYAGAPTPNPRSLLLDAVTAMDVGSGVRVRELVYLLVTTPDYIHQK